MRRQPAEHFGDERHDLLAASQRVGDLNDELSSAVDEVKAKFENPLTRDVVGAMRKGVEVRELRERLGTYAAEFAVLQDAVLATNSDLQGAITDGEDFAAAFLSNGAGANASDDGGGSVEGGAGLCCLWPRADCTRRGS